MSVRNVLVSATIVLGLATQAQAEGAPAAGPGKGFRGALKERILQKFDKDGDGKLAPEERAAAREAFVDRIMQRFDKDGDGKLSREELGAALGALRQRVEQARQRRAGKGPGAQAGPRL